MGQMERVALRDWDLWTDNHFEAAEEQHCGQCGKPTRWVDVDYQTFLCSPECVHAMDLGAAIASGWRPDSA